MAALSSSLNYVSYIFIKSLWHISKDFKVLSAPEIHWTIWTSPEFPSAPSRRLRLPTPLQSMPRWGPRLWSRRQRRQRRWWCPECRKGHPCAAILDDIGARHDVLRLLVARSSGIFSSLWALKPGNFSNSQLTHMISKSQDITRFYLAPRPTRKPFITPNTSGVYFKK